MDILHPSRQPSIPLASPASASSSTLITTPLPVGRSKESLRLPSSTFDDSLEDPARDANVGLDSLPRRVPQRPQTRRVPLTGNGTALLPTRMSASGFVEPHHSNVPRRVRVRAQTRTRSGSRAKIGAQAGDDVSEDGTDDEGDEGRETGNGDSRRLRELRMSVKEALTPGRRWSDSEDGNKDEDKGEAAGLPLEQDVASRIVNQKNDTDPAMLRTSITASQSLYAVQGGPTPTSSRNLNTERTPLHLLSLKLPPSPTDTAGPVLASAPAATSGGAPQHLEHRDSQAEGLPRTAPAGSSVFPVPLLAGQPDTPKASQVPHISTSSLRPATLPRRRRPGPTAGTSTPTPAPTPTPKPTLATEEREGASSDGNDSDKKAAVSAPAPIPTLPLPDDTVALPVSTPGPSKTPATGAVGVRFHGHHSSSSSSSSAGADSSKGSVRRRQKDGPQASLVDSRRAAVVRAEPAGVSERKLGRRNTVSTGVGVGASTNVRAMGKLKGRDARDMEKVKTKEKRSRSCATPRARARSAQRVGGVDADVDSGGGGRASPAKSARFKEKARVGDSSGVEADGDSDRALSRARQQAVRETRLAQRDKRREERRDRRESRREREERMCVQRIGSRGRVEVAFFLDGSSEGFSGVGEGEEETQSAYVLLQAIEPELDSEDEDDDDDEWDSDWELDTDAQDKGEAETSIPARTSTSEVPSSLGLPPTPTPISTSGQQARTDATHETKELKLYLSTDLSTHIDGVPALSTAQVRQGCNFIETILSSSDVSALPEPFTSRPCRVRVIAPRGRPEEAWAIALCYQAGVDSAAAGTVKTASIMTTSAFTTTSASPAESSLTSVPALSRPSAGAARLRATTNPIAIACVSESSKETARRISVPVPVPPLALVRGEDGEVEGVVELAVDIEALDEEQESTKVDITSIDSGNDDDLSTTLASPDCITDVDLDPSAVEETFMLHPTYTYPAIHCLVMRLLDEGVGEWHTRGRLWEDRVERMQDPTAGAVAGVGIEAVKASIVGVAHRHMRQEPDTEEEDEDVDGLLDRDDDDDEDWEEDGDAESDTESEENLSGDDEDYEEDFVDVQSAGARQGSESTGELDANANGADSAAYPNDDGEYERGRTDEPHTRTGQAHHGVPLPRKYEEPSSAFVSSAYGRSKSRARSKSKAESRSKSRARSTMSASASKVKRKSRLSMSYDPFLDDDDCENDENAVVDKATKKARRAELRRLRLIQRRARKEEEEVAAYAGIRTEWRGVLSFDGLQKLVGVWTPTSSLTSCS